MLSMGAYSNPFDSQAAILPTDPNTIPVSPAETKETDQAEKPEEQVPKKSFFGWRSAKPLPQAADPEKASEMRRPTKVIAPIYNGLGVALALCAYRPFALLGFATDRPKSLHGIRLANATHGILPRWRFGPLLVDRNHALPILRLPR